MSQIDSKQNLNILIAIEFLPLLQKRYTHGQNALADVRGVRESMWP